MKHKLFAVVFTMLLGGSIIAQQGNSSSAAEASGFGVPVFKGREMKVTYNLQDLDQNTNLSADMRKTLMQAKKRYPAATRMVRNLALIGNSWQVTGDSYLDNQGNILYYSVKY